MICNKDEKLLFLIKKMLNEKMEIFGVVFKIDEMGCKGVICCFWLFFLEGLFNIMMVSSEFEIRFCRILLIVGFKFLYLFCKFFNDFKKVGMVVREIMLELVFQFFK